MKHGTRSTRVRIVSRRTKTSYALYSSDTAAWKKLMKQVQLWIKQGGHVHMETWLHKDHPRRAKLPRGWAQERAKMYSFEWTEVEFLT